MDIKKFYYAVPAGKVTNTQGQEDECTHIECCLYYSLGGNNPFTYRDEARGYYLGINPVTVREYGDGARSVGFMAFHGRKMLLVECARKSKKSEQQAVALFDAKAQEVIRQLYPNAEIDFTQKAA